MLFWVEVMFGRWEVRARRKGRMLRRMSVEGGWGRIEGRWDRTLQVVEVQRREDSR